MFILIIVFFNGVFVCLFIFLFHFQKEHKFNVVSHGKKLSPNTLTVPGDGNEWSCPLLKAGYKNISHGLICALSVR